MKPQGKTEKERAYLAHLNSPYWDSLRRDVVARAEGMCEMCGEARLTQVHHLHYNTLGQETLHDVRGLCGRCHRYCHGLLPEQLAKKASRKGKHKDNSRRIRHAHRLLERKGITPKGKGLKPFPNKPLPETQWDYREKLLAQFKHP